MSEKASSNTIKLLGFWSAVLMIAFFIFCGPLAVLFASLPAFTFEIMQRISLIPGFLIAPTFIILMVTLHYCAPEDKKIMSHIGLAFAIIFAVMLSLSYYLQLTVVHQFSLMGNKEAIRILDMTNPQSLYWVIEMLAYGFLCAATLFIAPIFKHGRLETWLRWLFVANGIIGIASASFYVIDPNWVFKFSGLSGYVAWNIIFLLALILLSIWFKRAKIKA